MIQLLEKLTQIPGPSGSEDEVRSAILCEIKNYCDEITEDALGNLIARRRGSGKRLMLAAHMDEIGVIVTFAEKEGCLRFAPLGGVRVHTALHQKVRFTNGVIGVVSAGEGMEVKGLKMEDLFIDIGASNGEEAAARVPVGTPGVFDGGFDCDGTVAVSKAMDNRAGCACLIKTMQTMGASANDLYFVFTVQEELGLRGAKTAAFAIEPDYGLAVDVSPAGGVPDGIKSAVALGKGPAVKVKDALVMSHPFVRGLLLERAREVGVDCQLEAKDTGGTDAGAIHISRSGVPSGVLSIPVKFVHSPREMVHLQDLEQAVRLLCAVAERTL